MEELVSQYFVNHNTMLRVLLQHFGDEILSD